MAKFTRIQVATVMESNGLVPLFFHSDIEVAKSVLKACYDGGARLLEFTSRGDFAIDVFRELNHYVLQELPEMILGVGSVTDVGTASQYIHYGANFVVTPVLREDIAIVCNRRKVLWSAGCATLTEIARAEELGCEIVKVFPGGTLGAGFVKAIKGPCPWTSIMITGGVSPDEANLKGWFDAGATCVGMGSNLITKDALSSKKYEQIEDKVRQALSIIGSVRTGSN